MLAIYCWTGNITGNYWFGEHRGTASTKYSGDINKIVNVEKYYDDMAIDYEEVVRSWGYNMPESVVDSLIHHANISKHETFKLLDLGCGDGLCGLVFKVKNVFKAVIQYILITYTLYYI